MRMETETVIRFYGSRANVARALKISRGAISQWGEKVPLTSAVRLEQLTGGRLKVNLDAYPYPPTVRQS